MTPGRAVYLCIPYASQCAPEAWWAPAAALPGAAPLQDGLRLVVDGTCVGVIGVSSDTPQIGEAIAVAGAGALRSCAHVRQLAARNLLLARDMQT